MRDRREGMQRAAVANDHGPLPFIKTLRQADGSTRRASGHKAIDAAKAVAEDAEQVLVDLGVVEAGAAVNGLAQDAVAGEAPVVARLVEHRVAWPRRGYDRDSWRCSCVLATQNYVLATGTRNLPRLSSRRMGPARGPYLSRAGARDPGRR